MPRRSRHADSDPVKLARALIAIKRGLKEARRELARAQAFYPQSSLDNVQVTLSRLYNVADEMVD